MDELPIIINPSNKWKVNEALKTNLIIGHDRMKQDKITTKYIII